jgi:DNA-directed RNA polymerase specialized sigma24 family protein
VTEASGAETRDETRWVEAARRGDRGAFERLYDRYAATVHGILLARVPRSLPEAYRETLILRLVEGMTGPEIGRPALRLPEPRRPSVRPILAGAR